MYTPLSREDRRTIVKNIVQAEKHNQERSRKRRKALAKKARRRIGKALISGSEIGESR